LYQLQLLAGRPFSDKLASDSAAILLNEAALKVLGFRSPDAAVGQKVQYESEREIIGVVKDFNHYSLEQAVVPIILEFHRTNPKFYSLKVVPSRLKETLASIQRTYANLFPNSPFEYYFLDEAFDQQYKADQQFGRLFGLFSGLAIFIACLGLFGLSLFTTTQRTKEIGVRKVLGATVPNILLLLSKDFIKLVLVANVVAWPLTYWGVHKWLENYAFRIEIDSWLFLFPALLVLLIALVTVSFQTIKAARRNPVKALRYE
jgi:putative ABC transport system permease protein